METQVTLPAETDRRVDAAPRPLDDRGPRYVMRALLGEGGMGEVRLCRDAFIGRDVALKVLRPDTTADPDTRGRFEREARVQGQLEHPSIAPVYDLAIDPEGAPFFTMKRVRGSTLADLLNTWPRAKLLGAFESVCQAVAYAHARGVIHRDLKPANVMIGDFGEVYVLDWGLAKVAGANDLALNQGGGVLSANHAPGETMAGTVLGTPGYMPPEQARGELEKLDERADVFALGAILYEVLTRDPLIAQGELEDVLTRTKAGVDARRPDLDLPPELEAICVRATATDPNERYLTAVELLADLERFLEGDRDQARRRVLADEHTARAEQLIERSEDETLRAEALRELGRALALDPSHPRAVPAMIRLLVSPPREMPRDAEEEHREVVHASNRAAARMGSFTLIGWWIAAPLLYWIGGLTQLVVLIPATITFFVGLLVARLPRPTTNHAVLLFGLNAITVATSSVMFGPFVLMPALAIASACMFSVQGAWAPRRGLILGLTLLALIAPLLLEWIGVLPRSYEFRDGALVILPRFASFVESKAIALFILGHTILAIAPPFAIGVVSDGSYAVERRLFRHMWQLRQLVPEPARR